MKGVLLAGGTGSRLRPITNVINKHILPVGRYPMIYHPLRTLFNGGISQVMIVTGKEHMGTVVSQLGSGSTLGMDITYKVQDEPDGIAGALRLCEDFVGEENFTVILGDNIFTDGINKHLARGFVFNSKEKLGPVCKLFFQPMSKEELVRFGVPVFKDADGAVLRIEEKPKKPKSKYCVTGLYIYDKNIWKIIHGLEKSKRAEFEISDVNSWYAENGLVEFAIMGSGCWVDAGTPESLIKANIQMSKVIYDDWEPKDI